MKNSRRRRQRKRCEDQPTTACIRIYSSGAYVWRELVQGECLVVVLVKVQRITSYTDPETLRPGKIIELVEVRRGSGFQAVGMGEESVMVQRMLQTAMLQLQSMGLMPVSRENMFPKIILYVTEQEYDMLNVKLEVNEVYEVSFNDGSIVFKRPQGIG
ncbi:MAG: arcadin 1 [Candidatus Caldarchaeum sp.]